MAEKIVVDIPDGVANFQDVVDALRRAGGVVRDSVPTAQVSNDGEAVARLSQEICLVKKELCQEIFVLKQRLCQEICLIKQGLQVLCGRLTRVEGAAGASQSSHGDVCGILERLVSRLDSLDSSISAAVTQRDGVSGRLAALEAEVARLRSAEFECVGEVREDRARRRDPCRCRRVDPLSAFERASRV
jgi:hypothetical protein